MDTLPEAPSAIDVPLIVTVEFASLALAILPASLAAVIVPGAYRLPLLNNLIMLLILFYLLPC